jgi:hypothetical protein
VIKATKGWAVIKAIGSGRRGRDNPNEEGSVDEKRSPGLFLTQTPPDGEQP